MLASFCAINLIICNDVNMMSSTEQMNMLTFSFINSASCSATKPINVNSNIPQMKSIFVVDAVPYYRLEPLSILFVMTTVVNCHPTISNHIDKDNNKR